MDRSAAVRVIEDALSATWGAGITTAPTPEQDEALSALGPGRTLVEIQRVADHPRRDIGALAQSQPAPAKRSDTG